MDFAENKPQDATGAVTLRVLYPGQFFLINSPIDVFLDGRPIGRGTCRGGIDIRAETSVGAHVLTVQLLGGIRRKEYSLVFNAPCTCNARLTYSRAWGTFTDTLELQFSAPLEV